MIAHTCAASTHLIGFIAEWVCAPRKLLCTIRDMAFRSSYLTGVSALSVTNAAAGPFLCRKFFSGISKQKNT